MPNYIERRFPVFKAGTHTDSGGQQRTWTPADLDHMASAYDPAHHEAPVVIGHPKDNSPAFGWVKGLSHEDGMIYARAELVPEFDEMVRKGLFKKRSISLYEDGSLRHIGFLGARPPAVKGLPDIRFNDGKEAAVVIVTNSLQGPNGNEVPRGKPRGFKGDYPALTLFRSTLRGMGPRGNQPQGGREMKFFEWARQLAGKEGVTLEDLPPSFSEAEIEKRIEKALTEERTRIATGFAEARKAEEEKLRKREEDLNAKEREARNKGIASFCEALEREGRLTPAMMKAGMGMTNFLTAIGSMDGTIEFGETDHKTSQTPLEFMEMFLRGLPKAIEFGEVAFAGKDPGAKGDSGKWERLVESYMEKNPSASYREAILIVSKENPELFQERE